MSWAAVAIGAVLFAWVIVFGWGERTVVIGDSMSPSLVNGQEVLIDRVRYNILEPKKGDIVVFKPNGNENVHTYVKRIVAVPGDKVLIQGGILFLNGEPQDDMFRDSIADAGIASQEITMGEDEYFVMGDNCNFSEDSRTANIGNVRFETITGKVWYHMAGGNMGIGKVN